MFEYIPRDKWIPISEAKPGETYEGYQDSIEPDSSNYCLIVYKGNGIGWKWGKEENTVENITFLNKRLSYRELSELKRQRFDLSNDHSQLNLYGLYTDLYSIGDATHEMWNGWVDCDFYDMDYTLRENGIIFVGVAEAPWQPHYNDHDTYLAFIAEYVSSGERFWCHGGKSTLETLRRQMKDVYEELMKRRNNNELSQ